MRILEAGAAALGMALSPRQVDAFRRYRDLLARDNRRAGLTSIVEPEAVEARHFLDSLTCAAPLLAHWGAPDLVPPLDCLDVGSGGGFPGVPLKLALPQLRLTLLEATAKKADFLRKLVANLHLDATAVLAARAEEVAHYPAHRERYDVVLARALAPLAPLLELTLPFLQPGGMLVAPRKGDTAQAVEAAAAVSAALGGGTPRLLPIPLPALADGRVLLVVEKTAPAPTAYPRRPGIPVKRPLGQR